MSDIDLHGEIAIGEFVRGRMDLSYFEDLHLALQRGVREWGTVAEAAKRLEEEVNRHCQGTTYEQARAERLQRKVERLEAKQAQWEEAGDG